MGIFRVAFLLTLLFAAFSPVCAKDTRDKVIRPIIRSHIPSLLEITRFSGTIQFCGESIPYDNPEIRERLEKEMMLAVWNRPQVLLWLKRANRYFIHIEQILKQEGLPLDIKYIPVVESALLPHSRSEKGAVGYWQFIKSTGKKYGLRIDRYIDQRKNLFKSSRAACRYLKKLNEQFGSYLLAAAAYNMGEYGLAREIQAQDCHDSFSLYLPLETQRYLLKLVAAKLIIEHPERYGFQLTAQDLYPVFTYSKLNFAGNEEIPLVLIAKSAGISFKTLKDYNPDIRGYYLQGKYTGMMIPKGSETGFQQRFAALHKSWKNKTKAKERIHVVRSGESLSAIASQYNMSLPALLKLNRFSHKKVIHPGDRLLVQ